MNPDIPPFDHYSYLLSILNVWNSGTSGSFHQCSFRDGERLYVSASGACDKGMEGLCTLKRLYGTKQAAAAWQKFLKALCIAAVSPLTPQG
jgi:hypothetical protein